MPLSIERWTPPRRVPIKRFVLPVPSGQATRSVRGKSVKPVLTAVQLVPLLVERNTQLSVPAKRFAPPAASPK